MQTPPKNGFIGEETRLADGSTFAGEWKMDMMHGRGTLKFQGVGRDGFVDDRRWLFVIVFMTLMSFCFAFVW